MPHPRVQTSKNNNRTLFKNNVCSLLVLASAFTFAGPEGGEVTSGEGSINQEGNTTTIEQMTDRLTLDWDSFDIHSDETVNFIQPDESSIAFNRINSLNGSEIHGHLNANGSVVLMNPHGVFFGENAVVNVGSILATGLRLDPNDFMNGEFTLNAIEGTEGVVINRGLINAASGGSVSLLGQRVENHGVITAELGVVNFAAGNEAVVTFGEGNFIGIRVTEAVVQEDIGVDPAIINTGDITAKDGKVLLTASTSQDIFSGAVNHGDLAYDRSVVVHEDGSFTLGEGADVNNSGSIFVSGDQGGVVVVLGSSIHHTGNIQANSSESETAGHIEIHSQATTHIGENSSISANADAGIGGDIKVLGDEILLSNHSIIEANGEQGGGDIRIGGDYRGENPFLPNAQTIRMEERAVINASALEFGSGGRVILYADETLYSLGHVSVQGVDGGGFIETSASYVNIDMSVDLGSKNGLGGEWLVDPETITISNTDPGDGTSWYSFETVQSALFGNNATLTIETDGEIAGSGDIYLNAVLGYQNWGNSSLTLSAHNDIFLSANVFNNVDESENIFNLTLNANTDGVTPDGESDGGGIVFNSGVAIDTNGGNFTATGDYFSSENGSLTVRGPNSSGNINVTANAGDATFGFVEIGNGNLNGTGSSAFNITAENINFNGNVSYGVGDNGNSGSANHPVTLTANARGNITVASGINFDNSYGADSLTLTFNADTNGSAEGDSTEDGVIQINNGAFFWLTGGSFTATGHDFIISSSGANTYINTEGGALNFGSSSNPLTGRFDSSSANTHLSSYSGSISGDVSIYTTEDAVLGDFRRNTTTDSNDSGDFDFIVSAGDDVILTTDLALGYLGGTGSNTLSFTAGNSATVASGDNADGILLNAELAVGTAGSFDFEFNGVSGGNLTTFENNGLIHSNGGSIEIFVDGSVLIDGTINTLGGAFTVGGNSLFPTTFDNYRGGSGGAITTASNSTAQSSGDITIITANTVIDDVAQGDVVLGTMNVYSLTGGQALGGNVTVTSGNDITLAQAFNFNDTGTGTSSTDDNPSFRTLRFNADDDIFINAIIHDTNAGDRDTLNVVLNANGTGSDSHSGTDDSDSGDIDINAAIYTGGGNLDIQGETFNNVGQIIRTGFSNESNGGNTTTGGHIAIMAEGNVDLGTLITENGFSGGYLSIVTDGNITQGAGSQLDVRQLATFNANRSNDATPGSITLNGSTNTFDTAIAIVDAQNLTITNAGNLVLDGSGVSDASRVRGNAIISTTNGTITDAGNWSITGTTSLVADTDEDIALDNANDFGGAVSITADDVEIRDAGTGATAGIDFGNVSVEDFTITAAGAITDSGNIIIRGNRVLTAGGVDENNRVNVTFDSAGNQFYRVVTPFAENVSITDSAGNFIFGDDNGGTQSNISGNLTITHNGGDTFHDGGTSSANDVLVNVAGFTSIITSGENVQLDNENNRWGTLSVNTSASGDAGSITINTLSLVTNTLNATSTGAGDDNSITINADVRWEATGAMQGESLTVNGNGDADTFVIGSGSSWTSSGNFIINAGNGNDVFQIYESTTAQLNGQNNNDRYEILAADITVPNINGGGNTDTIIGLSHATEVNTWTITGSGEGNITNNAGANVVTYQAVETLHGGSVVEDPDNVGEFIGGRDIFNVSTAASGTLHAQSGDDDINITAQWTGQINGGDGNDDFVISARVINSGSDVLGGNGNDSFEITNGLLDIEIDGGAGSNSIELTDTTNVPTQSNGQRYHIWTLSGARAGNVNGTSAVEFSNIDSIQAPDEANDSFVYSAASVFAGSVAAGEAADNSDTDSILYTVPGIYDIALGTSQSNVTEIETLNTQSTNNGAGYTLRIESDPDAQATGAEGIQHSWTINGTNSGTVTDGTNTVTFQNFGNLHGNQADDHFTIENTATTNGSIVSVRGTHDSSSPVDLVTNENNSLTINNGVNRFTLTGQFDGTVSEGHTLNFFDLHALNGQGADTLQARNQNNTWSFTATGMTVGETRTDTLPSTDLVTFTNITNVIGGSEDDTFIIDTALTSWQLSGAAGADQFTLTDNGSVLGAGALIDGGTSSDAEGNPHQDSIIARESAGNTFSINSIDGVSGDNTIGDGAVNYLRNFANIERLEGSDTHPDTYEFSVAIDLAITAGDGLGDVADYSRADGAVSVTVDTTWGIERFIGNNDGSILGGADQSTLTFESVSGQTVVWRIYDLNDQANVADGINDGTINSTIIFEDFNHLAGGNGNDTFTFDSNSVSAITGSLRGGNNTGITGDEIVGRNVASQWRVVPIDPVNAPANVSYQSGDGNRVVQTEFSEFETLTSGSADDTFTVETDLAEGQSLRLNAGEGTLDRLNLPASAQRFTLGTSNNGISGEGFETIAAVANFNNDFTVSSASGTNVYWDISGPNTGSVRIGSTDAEAVNFINFQALYGGAGNDQFNFTDSDSSVSRPGEEIGSVNGGLGSNTLIGREDVNRFELNGDRAGFVVAERTLATYVEGFTGIQTLIGYGSFDDTFNVRAGATFNGEIIGARDGFPTVGGADTLFVETAPGQTTQWRLLGDATAPDRVQRLASDGSVTSSITFDQMSQLTGGTGVDHFIMMAVGAYGGSINAGENASATDIDMVDLSQISGSTSATWQSMGVLVGTQATGQTIQNIEQVIGNGSTQLNTAFNQTLAWRIGSRDANNSVIIDASGNPVDGANDGEVRNASDFLQFINVATLAGEANAVDNFIVQSDGSISGTIQGNAGANIVDTLTVSTDNSVWQLTAANAGNVNGNNFTGIERITANGSGDRLQAFNQANRWEINGINSGSIGERLSDSASTNETDFIGIEHLVGHANVDVFDVLEGGQITGSIVGTISTQQDGLNDTLIVRSSDGAEVVWTLNVDAESNTSAQVAGRVQTAHLIETLTGDAGRDIFDVEDAAVSITVDGSTGMTDSIRLGGADQSGYAAEATWQINGGANETVSAQNQGSVTFSNIERAYGTNQRDTFTIADNTLAEFYGRGGDDQFTVVTDTVTELNLTLDGGANSNTLTGGDRINDWIIGGANADEANTLNYNAPDNRGVVFSNIQTLQGGSLADTFELREGTNVQVQGGSGNNTVSAPHDSGTVAWQINGDNAGNIQWNGITTTFNQIQNLTGGVGLDRFTFVDNDGNPNTDPTARLSGLIDGGDVALTDPVTIDNVIDTLDVSVFSNGVVVELGSVADPGTIVEGTSSLPNVNAFNIEEIRAAEHDPETGENNQWLAINEANVVIDWNVELDQLDPPLSVESDFNEGRVQHIESLENPVAIANTQTRFYNFGSLQGYQGENGQEQSNIIENGGNITGTFTPTSGQRTLIFTNARGQVIVDITPLVIGVQGNANTLGLDGQPIGDTLIRVAPGSEFNGDNAWVINGQNSGSFTADYYVDDEGVVGFGFNFTGVNQLQGGTGSDTFTFAHPENTSHVVGLRDGFIDGGPQGANTSVDQIIVNRASDINQTTLVFGVNSLTDQVTLNPADPLVHVYPDVIQDPLFYVNSREDVIDIAQIESLTVNDGDVALVSADTGTANWTLAATGSEITSIFNENTAASTLEFRGVNRVSGGGADDTFNLNQLGEANTSFALSNRFDAGEGNDTMNLSGITNTSDSALVISMDSNDADIADVILNEFETLTLTGTGHRLLARDIVNRWTINGENSGSLAFGSGDAAQNLQFSSISHLVGGNVQDIFTFSGDGEFTGTIDGAANTVVGDSIVVDATSTATLHFDITSRDATGNVVATTTPNAIAVEGIETFTGHSARATNTTLIGANANTQWIFTGVNAGQLSYTDNNDTARNIQFTNIANITGGSASDTFAFTRDNGVDDAITGILDGGSGTGVDTVTINGLTDLQTVALSATRDADLNLVGIETLQAIANNAYQLLGDNQNNLWEIDGTNTGNVAGVRFENFARLVGGTGNDTFEFTVDDTTMEDDRITGFVSGGAQPETGSSTDTIDATGLQHSLIVTLDPNYTQAGSNVLVVSNITHVNATADASRTNSFVGGNVVDTQYNWTINNRNAGSINSIQFTGFNALLGRNQVDVFSFEGAGVISGTVDGGGQPENTRDVVDVSDANNSNVTIGATTNGFENIEEYRGNNTTSILQAQNIENAWSLTDMNVGNIEDADGNTIYFNGFAYLVGGSDVDRFSLEGGGVTGDIKAGDGNDRLTIDLGTGINGEVRFEGQAGTDTVTINGGSATQRFNERYEAIIGGEASHEYEITTNDETLVYTVNYDTVENVNDNAFVNTLSVQSLANVADTIRLGDNRFVVSETNPDPENTTTWPDISLVNVNSMRIDAELGDRVILDGAMTLTGDFSISNADVEAQGDTARIAANRSVTFNATNTVGSDVQRIIVDSNALSLINTRDAVYLDLRGDMAINALQTPAGIVDIIADGNLTDGNALNSAQAFVINSSGNITFDNDNNLTGALSFNSPTGVITLNNGLTRFTSLQANTATLRARGNMNDGDDGRIAIADTLIIEGVDASNIIFDNATNTFNTVNVTNAGSLTLTDSSASGVTLQGALQQRLLVNANSAITVNSVTANDVVLTSRDESIIVQNPMTAVNLVQLTGEGIQINGDVTVTNATNDIAIQLDSQNGALAINGVLTATERDIVLRGQSVTQQDGANLVARNIDIDSTQDTTLMANITANNVLDVDAGGNLLMQSNVLPTSTRATTIELTADQMIETESLSATSVNIQSVNGDVTQNGNIVADTVIVRATNGNVTLADNISTTVNTGSLTVNSIDHSILGDIVVNTGTVTLDATGLSNVSGSLSVGEGGLVINGASQRFSGDVHITEGNATFTSASTTELTGSITVDNGNAIINSVNQTISGDVRLTQGDATFNASEDAELSSDISASNVTLNVDGQTTMHTGALIHAENAVTFDGGAIALGSLQAGNEVSIKATGAVTDNNESAVNISAPTLIIENEAGFGGYAISETIETQVGSINATNANGEIGITNDSTNFETGLWIDRLATNGNIRLENNNGNVVLNHNPDVDYDRTATDPRDAGGDLNSNYFGGDTTIRITGGALTATGAPNGRRPDLVGNVINVSTTGGFGTDRQLVVYARNQLNISGRGIRPIWAFGQSPAFGLTTDSDLLDPLAGVNVSELLVEAEAVSDINPAIFTEVRNYVYADISIRMPRDQIYDDEDEYDYGENY